MHSKATPSSAREPTSRSLPWSESALADFENQGRQNRQDAKLKKHVGESRISVHRCCILPVATLQIDADVQAHRCVACSRRAQAVCFHGREEPVFLDGGVQQVQDVEGGDCVPPIACICRIVYRLVHHVQRRVGLSTDEFAVSTISSHVRKQRVAHHGAILKRCAHKHKLRQCQHVRCKELTVAVEVPPHSSCARIAFLKASSLGIVPLRQFM